MSAIGIPYAYAVIKGERVLGRKCPVCGALIKATKADPDGGRGYARHYEKEHEPVNEHIRITREMRRALQEQLDARGLKSTAHDSHAGIELEVQTRAGLVHAYMQNNVTGEEEFIICIDGDDEGHLATFPPRHARLCALLIHALHTA